jgi:predicted hydrocarbon binding protein
MGLEAKDRVWNAIETKCLGLGDPYCEVKIVPGETDLAEASIKKDAEMVTRIHSRLIEKFKSQILNGEIPTNRPAFGPDIHLQLPFHNFGFSHIAGDHSRMAIRMGGAKSGKELTERLLAAGLQPDEVIDRIYDTFKTLKVGVVTKSDSRIIIEENIEPLRTWYMTRLRELSCHFTTGFLNGLHKTTHDLRINETKCIAAGDPHCEWEII